MFKKVLEHNRVNECAHMKQSAKTTDDGLHTSISELHACIKLKELYSIVTYETHKSSRKSRPFDNAMAYVVAASNTCCR
jgi:hypothetical protein